MSERAGTPVGSAPSGRAAGSGEVAGTTLPPRSPSRVAGLAALALLTVDGAFLGVFGLAFTPMYAGGFPVPMGVVLTVLILPWLVLRAGEIDPRAGAAGAPLLAWGLVVAVLAVGGPGGDTMLPVTWQSGLLVLGGIGAGLWALRQVEEY